MHAAELSSGFSSQKRATLLLLKQNGELSLQQVADGLKVTKVAALRHLASLESDGLVGRSNHTDGVGRPRAHFRLTEGAGALFPQAYSDLSLTALRFIEARLGHDAVVEMLQERARDLLEPAPSLPAGSTLAVKVEALARRRQESGYMAEVGARRRGSVEMLEHNCPILAIAGTFPEACDVERRSFERVLGARVETSHRVVAGDPVCRFLIRSKGGPR
ncbi:MAG: hypothetical protein L3K17_04045 [Thermoplasmata archaeon]|nr:hypothetical protein [Thermoplasmata archaeon]